MRRLAWLTAVLMVMALPLVAAAQTQTGRISGVVTDASGAVIPGVTVTIKAADTGVTSTTVTDSNGRYAVDSVAPGPYEITVELSGFTTQTSKVVVAAGQPVTLDVKLLVAAQAEQVQVTGTLIPRPTLEAMSPVTTMDVEQITYRGLTRMEDLLTSLPQVFAAQNSTLSNNSTGTATVDLRYLGSNRTLVLIDSRRMAPGDWNEIAVDLNFIPSALVKRVDILTGGASSVYGADAVAGVVNFIYDKQFQGVRGGISFSGYQHNNNNAVAQGALLASGFPAPGGSSWNSGAVDANVAIGGKFAGDKGHATLYFDYRDTAKFLKSERDYTACSFGLGDTGPICSGSSTIPNGRFLVFDADYISTGDFTLDTSGAGNTFRDRTEADVYNYGALNFMQRPDQRLVAGGFLDYRWNRHFDAYLEAALMDDYTDAQIAPSGDFGNTSLLNCDNPMLSAQQRKLLCTDAGYGPHDMANVTILRRNVEGGPRVDQLRHTAFRVTTGLKGDLGKGWAYDAYFLDAQVHIPESYANDVNANRLQEALIVDGDPNDPRTWRCRSGNPSCVPWNIFRVGGVTQEALDYLALPLVSIADTKIYLFNGKVTADLKEYGVALPAATEGIKVAFGGEYRNEFLEYNPDQAYRDYLAAGQGGPMPYVAGSYTVKELFVEGLIPIVQDARGAKDLALELGYRTSDYSNTGRSPTYKIQGSWAPVDDVKLRGGFNRATRSPNIVELYTPQALSLFGTQDICAGSTPTATLEQCARTGVTAAQYGKVLPNPAEQYNTLSGGNAALVPEIADTYAVGVVVTPRKLPGFSAALDYYNIGVTDTIGSLGADDVINTCASTGDPALCSLIHRDVAGTLWLYSTGYTVTTNRNVGKLASEGLDVNSTYVRPLGNAGSLSVNLIGTYLMKSYINTGLFAYDCKGYFGNQCGIPTPAWRHFFRGSWDTTFKTTFSVGWRFVGPVTNDDGSPNPAIGDPGNVELLKINDIYEIGAQSYFDVSAVYKLTRNFSIIGGINNIFDKEPPIAPGMSTNDYGPGFYGTYDPYGRYLFASVQVTF